MLHTQNCDWLKPCVQLSIIIIVIFFLQFLLLFGKVEALKPAWVGYGEKEKEFSYGSLQD